MAKNLVKQAAWHSGIVKLCHSNHIVIVSFYIIFILVAVVKWKSNQRKDTAYINHFWK